MIATEVTKEPYGHMKFHETTLEYGLEKPPKSLNGNSSNTGDHAAIIINR